MKSRAKAGKRSSCTAKRMEAIRRIWQGESFYSASKIIFYNYNFYEYNFLWLNTNKNYKYNVHPTEEPILLLDRESLGSAIRAHIHKNREEIGKRKR